MWRVRSFRFSAEHPRCFAAAAPLWCSRHGIGAADCYGTRPEHVFDLLADCGLGISLMKDWLEHGTAKAFTRAAFSEEFDTGSNFYYLAHPT